MEKVKYTEKKFRKEELIDYGYYMVRTLEEIG